MLVLGPGSEAGMIACFLGAELTSERFGPEIRSALAASGHAPASYQQGFSAADGLGSQQATCASKGLVSGTVG